jgi:hypothetical protein
MVLVGIVLMDTVERPDEVPATDCAIFYKKQRCSDGTRERYLLLSSINAM